MMKQNQNAHSHLAIFHQFEKRKKEKKVRKKKQFDLISNSSQWLTGGFEQPVFSRLNSFDAVHSSRFFACRKRVFFQGGGVERSGLQPNGQGRITAHITTSLSFLSTTHSTIYTSHLTPSSSHPKKALLSSQQSPIIKAGRVCVCVCSLPSHTLTTHTRLLIETRERVWHRSSRARQTFVLYLYT